MCAATAIAAMSEFERMMEMAIQSNSLDAKAIGMHLRNLSARRRAKAAVSRGDVRTLHQVFHELMVDAVDDWLRSDKRRLRGTVKMTVTDANILGVGILGILRLGTMPKMPKWDCPLLCLGSGCERRVLAVACSGCKVLHCVAHLDIDACGESPMCENCIKERREVVSRLA